MLNKVLILGNLGADPELRYTSSQLPICTMRIATSEKRKGADGQWTEQTEWHSVVAFGKTAENCAQYLAKGRKAFVEGRIQTKKWQDQEGKDRYKTEVIANTVTFVGGAGSRDGSQLPIEKSQSDYNFASSPDNGAIAEQAMSSAAVSFDDDDIPF